MAFCLAYSHSAIMTAMGVRSSCEASEAKRFSALKEYFVAPAL